MGADKNLSRRMNSAYAPNPQPRIPTRVCKGRVVTTDLATLGTNPNSKQYGNATQVAKDFGNMRSLGQTVRGDRADSLLGPGGQSTRPRRTVRNNSPSNLYSTSKYEWSVPYPRTVREQLVPRGRFETGGRQSANRLQQKPSSSSDRNASRSRTKELVTNTCPGGLSVD
jgi:hypothetical protein